MRTIADLPQDSIDALDKLCKKDQVSRAELLRRAVAEYLSRRAVLEDDAAFGLWKNDPHFDTNILIDYLNGRAQARVEFSKYDAQAISIITWIEIMIGVIPSEEDTVRRFLDRFECLPVSPAVAERAVSIRREHHIRVPEALIWASALCESALLVTRNTRDFPKREPSVRVPYR